MPRKGYDYDPAYNNQANKMEVKVKLTTEHDNAYNLITGLQAFTLTPTDRSTTPVNNIVGRSSVFAGSPQKPTGSLTFGEITVSMAHLTLQNAHDESDDVTIQRTTYGKRVTPTAGITLSAQLQWQVPASGVINNAALIAALGEYSVDWDGATIMYEPTSGTTAFYSVDTGIADDNNNLQSLRIASSPDGTALASTTSGTTFAFPYNRNAATPSAHPTAAAQTGKLHVFQGFDQFLEVDFEVLSPLLPSDDAVGLGEAYIPTNSVNLQGTSTERRQYALPPAS